MTPTDCEGTAGGKRLRPLDNQKLKRRPTRGHNARSEGELSGSGRWGAKMKQSRRKMGEPLVRRGGESKSRGRENTGCGKSPPKTSS